MASTVLELRHYEEKYYYTEWSGVVSSDAYAVALVEAPSFPGERGGHHPESKFLIVICAARYKTQEGKRPGEKLWGWIHLGPDAKEEIGKDLARMNAEIGHWYYLSLSPESGEMEF